MKSKKLNKKSAPFLVCYKMTDDERKTVMITYDEFKEFFSEESKFKKYVVDENIEIEYWYVESQYEDWINLRWKIPDTKTIYKKRYNGSSAFAMWWCQMDDE